MSMSSAAIRQRLQLCSSLGLQSTATLPTIARAIANVGNPTLQALLQARLAALQPLDDGSVSFGDNPQTGGTLPSATPGTDPEDPTS